MPGGLQSIQDIDSADGLVVVVGPLPSAGAAGPPGTPDAGMAVAVSRDAGVTWALHPLPTVETSSVRTGSSGAIFAKVSITSEGGFLVAAMLAPDVERNLIGGPQIPGQLQQLRDIAVYLSHDGGTSWQTTLLSTGKAAFYVEATAFPEGGAVVTWSESDGDEMHFTAAMSLDLSSWIATPAMVPCAWRSEAARLGPRIFVACVDEQAEAGDVHLLEVRPDEGSTSGLDLGLDEPLSCRNAHLFSRQGRLLLVGSGCPGIAVLSTTDVTRWRAEAALPAGSIGPVLEDYESIMLRDAALDDRGYVHGVMVRLDIEPLGPGGSAKDSFSHVVFDPAGGTIQHQAHLASVGLQPDTAAGMARQVIGHTEASVRVEGNVGWIGWPDVVPGLGLYEFASL
jgi:hypothetical protein